MRDMRNGVDELMRGWFIYQWLISRWVMQVLMVHVHKR